MDVEPESPNEGACVCVCKIYDEPGLLDWRACERYMMNRNYQIRGRVAIYDEAESQKRERLKIYDEPESPNEAACSGYRMNWNRPRRGACMIYG